MALRDTLKNLFGIPENEYDGEYDDEVQSNLAQNTEEEQVPLTAAPGGKHNRVVNIHATTQLAVVLVKPERYEDAASIADHLNAKKTVVLNLEQTSKDVSRRLIDFLCGVAYANNGQMKQCGYYGRPARRAGKQRRHLLTTDGTEQPCGTAEPGRTAVLCAHRGHGTAAAPRCGAVL